MTKRTFGEPRLYVEHVPETHRTMNSDRSVTEDELPGHVIVGVEVDGVKIPLERRKAAGVLADIARAAQAQPSE